MFLWKNNHPYRKKGRIIMSKFKDDVVNEYVNEVQKFCFHRDKTGPQLEPCNYTEPGYECYLKCKLCGAIFEMKSLTPDELQPIRDRANELRENVIRLTETLKVLVDLDNYEVSYMMSIHDNLNNIDYLCDYYSEVLRKIATSKSHKRTKRKRKDNNK